VRLAVATVDVPDHLLAAVGGEVQVNVGHCVAFVRQVTGERRSASGGGAGQADNCRQRLQSWITPLA
jgi:hypothetical protein